MNNMLVGLWNKKMKVIPFLGCRLSSATAPDKVHESFVRIYPWVYGAKI